MLPAVWLLPKQGTSLLPSTGDFSPAAPVRIQNLPEYATASIRIQLLPTQSPVHRRKVCVDEQLVDPQPSSLILGCCYQLRTDSLPPVIRRNKQRIDPKTEAGATRYRMTGEGQSADQGLAVERKQRCWNLEARMETFNRVDFGPLGREPRPEFVQMLRRS